MKPRGVRLSVVDSLIVNLCSSLVDLPSLFLASWCLRALVVRSYLGIRDLDMDRDRT